MKKQEFEIEFWKETAEFWKTMFEACFAELMDLEENVCKTKSKS